MDSFSKRIFSVVFILFLSAWTVSAAPSYTVRGTVAGAADGLPEAMATVLALSQGEKVSWTSCAADGTFTLSLPGPGEYEVRVVSLGRKELSRTVTLSESSPSADLGLLEVEDDKEQLEAAVVTEQVPYVKNEVDRLTYKISEDPDAKTSNALDMLRKVPRVTVDGDDNIKVNGQGSFKIYVNGKPSNLFSNNPGQILKSLPAESIKKIEVISDPGAKYDAEGVGGILNIVMNTDRSDGYNISVNASGGNRGANAGAYAAVKTGRLTVSANYGFNYYTAGGARAISDRETYGADGQLQQKVTSENTTGQKAPMHYGTLEMSYEIDSLNLLTLSGNLFIMNGKADYGLDYSASGPQGLPLYSYRQEGAFANKFGSSSVNFDYQHTFRSVPGSTLTLSYRYGNDPAGMDSRYDVVSFEGDPAAAPFLHKYIVSTNNALSQEHTAQADYVLPFADIHRIEAGLKYIGRFNTSEGTNRFRESEDGEWADNPDSPSIDYDHTQHIAALYADYALSLGHFGMKAGVRAEQTVQTITYIKPDGGSIRSDFTDIVPNLSLMWMPTMTQSLQLTYNMRISRPGITQLSPFRTSTSASEVMYGNPDIVSEKNHTVALNYSLFDAKYGVNASLRWSFTNNSISAYRFVDEEGLLNTTYANVGKDRKAGLSAYAYWNPSQNTRIYLNGDISYAVYSGDKDNAYLSSLGRRGFAGSAFLGFQQSFKYGFRLGANGGYFASGVTLQGRGSGSYFYSLSLSKSFLDGKLSLSLNASNFVGQYMRYTSITDTPYLKSTDTYLHPSRYITAGISFNFGNLRQGVRKVNRSIVNDDVKAASSGNAAGAPQGGGMK